MGSWVTEFNAGYDPFYIKDQEGCFMMEGKMFFHSEELDISGAIASAKKMLAEFGYKQIEIISAKYLPDMEEDL